MSYYTPSIYTNESTDSVNTIDTVTMRGLLKSNSSLTVSEFSKEDLISSIRSDIDNASGASGMATHTTTLPTQEQTRVTQSEIRAAYERIHNSITSTNRQSIASTNRQSIPPFNTKRHSTMSTESVDYLSRVSVAGDAVTPIEFCSEVEHVTYLIKSVVDKAEEGQAAGLEVSMAASSEQVIALLEQVGRLIALQPHDEQDSVSEFAYEVDDNDAETTVLDHDGSGNASTEERELAVNTVDAAAEEAAQILFPKLKNGGKRVLASLSLITHEGEVLSATPVRSYVVAHNHKASSMTLSSVFSGTSAHTPVSPITDTYADTPTPTQPSTPEPKADAKQSFTPNKHPTAPNKPNTAHNRQLHPLQMNPPTPNSSATILAPSSAPFLSPACDEDKIRSPTMQWWQSPEMEGYTGLEGFRRWQS